MNFNQNNKKFSKVEKSIKVGKKFSKPSFIVHKSSSSLQISKSFQINCSTSQLLTNLPTIQLKLKKLLTNNNSLSNSNHLFQITFHTSLITTTTMRYQQTKKYPPKEQVIKPVRQNKVLNNGMDKCNCFYHLVQLNRPTPEPNSYGQFKEIAEKRLITFFKAVKEKQIKTQQRKEALNLIKLAWQVLIQPNRERTYRVKGRVVFTKEEIKFGHFTCSEFNPLRAFIYDCVVEHKARELINNTETEVSEAGKNLIRIELKGKMDKEITTVKELNSGRVEELNRREDSNSRPETVEELNSGTTDEFNSLDDLVNQANIPVNPSLYNPEDGTIITATTTNTTVFIETLNNEDSGIFNSTAELHNSTPKPYNYSPIRIENPTINFEEEEKTEEKEEINDNQSITLTSELLNSTSQLSNSTPQPLIDNESYLNFPTSQPLVNSNNSTPEPNLENIIDIIPLDKGELVEPVKINKKRTVLKAIERLTKTSDHRLPALKDIKTTQNKAELAKYLRELAESLDETQPETRGVKRKAMDSMNEEEEERIVSHQTRKDRLKLEFTQQVGSRNITKILDLEQAIEEKPEITKKYFLNLEKTKPKSFKPTYSKYCQLLSKILN